ncbi:MAG TPA: alpha-hydroxy-acid oxidizing protein [Thermomicrobiaceae bacterium]|nr:alpha-hydroxy-acid oxidizing protein [Thermomicrobiaceae bacterium]
MTTRKGTAMTRYGLDAQLRIYGGGAPPELPIAVEEWEARARAALPPEPFDYVAGGAGGESTMRANREAFDRWRIRPRLLRPVEDRDLGVTVLGTPSAAPFLLAPIGVLSAVRAEADVAVGRAAATTGIPFVVSSVSSRTLEEVAAAMGDAPRWFQLYPARDRDVMASFLSRAEAAGYRAVVVTVDTTMLGWRERDLAHAYLPFLQAQGIANYLSDPAFRAGLERPPEVDVPGAVRHFLDVFVNPSFAWEDVDWLRGWTRLPLLLKGLTHPDDAVQAVAHGVDGVIVSNHGGRQVDGAVAALDALPEVVDALDGRVPVLFDSGVRRGADVLKALALGAAAVLVGRPYAYALAVAGEEGVATLIRQLTADIDLTLALSGRRAVAEVDGALLTRARP